MIELIEYKDSLYPKFQTEGNASQFAIPFAKHFCKGIGYDIGCNRIEWAFPGAIPIDLNFKNGWDAYHLPEDKVDYIYSSHCLEHLVDWVEALDYWGSKLKEGGVMFLYLPSYNQKYWRPWNNRKHIHAFEPAILADYFKDREYSKWVGSGVDLNSSFTIAAEK